MIYGNAEMDKYIISIPDFPVPGIIFRDVTSVLRDPEGFKLAIDEMQKFTEGVEYDAIVGLESRGFLFGSPIAYNCGKAFIPVRKKGKLPREVVRKKYSLEYGEAEIEVHRDDIKPGMKVILLDDLIATGGTLAAAAELVESLGAEVVKIITLLELKGLKGRELLSKYDLDAVISYDGK